MGERHPEGKKARPASSPPNSGTWPAGTRQSVGDRDETVRVSALEEQELRRPDPGLALHFHRRVAEKFLKDGAPHRAFNELLKAAQTLPIDGRLATELSRLARVTSAEAAAAAALTLALPRADPSQRSEIRRRIATLQARLGRFDAAHDYLADALAEKPGDWRARRLLIRLAVQGGAFALAIRSLEEEIAQEAGLQKYRSAARSAMRRGRLLEEKTGDLLDAGASFAHAADLASLADDGAMAFSARVLSARALAAAKAPAEDVKAAIEELGAAARRAGRVKEAERVVHELGKGSSQARGLALLSESARARGAHEEALALLRAAVDSDPRDKTLSSRLENLYIARGAWRELAALYRERADGESDPTARLELLSRLAELLEDELGEPRGAAEVYGELVRLTGDSAALAAQVRLLSAGAGAREALSALDAAVRSATEAAPRLAALLLRGETHLSARRLDSARDDFQAALALAPDNLRALAGLAESASSPQRVEAFEKALGLVARGDSARLPLLRRLARLLEFPLEVPVRAQAAWREVLAEVPGDAEAEGRLLELARLTGSDEELVRLLQQRLAREPRGPGAREARDEMAHCLERLGRLDEALSAWKVAVQTDPGDKGAWLALAERHEAAGRFSDAMNAVEEAAAATEPGPGRAQLWRRAARLLRDRLGDVPRAEKLEARAAAVLGPAPASDAKQTVEMPAPVWFAAPAENPVHAAPTVEIPVQAAPTVEIPALGATPMASATPPPRRPEKTRLQIPFDTVLGPSITPTAVPQVTGGSPPPVLDLPFDPHADDDEEEVAPTPGSPEPLPQPTKKPQSPFNTPPEPIPFVRSVVVPPPGVTSLEPETTRQRTEKRPPPAPFAAAFEPVPAHDPPMEIRTGEYQIVLDPAPLARPPPPPRPTPLSPFDAVVPPPVPPIASPPSRPAIPARARTERYTTEIRRLHSRIANDPFHPDSYRALAISLRGPAPHRSAILEEIADALEGKADEPAAPTLTLGDSDWGVLRHPDLRASTAELFAAAGAAMCDLEALEPEEAGAGKPFSMESNKGARATGEALLTAVRVLGVRAVDIRLCDDNSPPIRSANTDPPLLLVGKSATKRKPLPSGQLRFFAGRALATLRPELMALRHIPPRRLAAYLTALKEIVGGECSLSTEARALANYVPRKAHERLRRLAEHMDQHGLPIERLCLGARHTANRAGLIAAGGTAPAIAALQVKRGGSEELGELLLFAISEPYLALRTRMGRKFDPPSACQ